MVHETCLDNGLWVLSQDVPYVRTVSVGLWMRTGSRHEGPGEAGASHFIEHLLFKGTRNKSAREISEEIDLLGGYMNAFTAKEHTCLYAKVPREHFKATLELMGEMLLEPLFDPGDIDRERQVVMEEIATYEDNPEGVVHDLLYSALWPSHPLGRPVLGEPETLLGLGRDTLLDFFHTHYTPDRMVLSAVGRLDHREVVSEARRILGQKGRVAHHGEMSPPAATPGKTQCHRDTEQVHICVGFPTVPMEHPDVYPLLLLGEIMGGSASSRLFQRVREDLGLVYSIYSSASHYSDGGTFLAYAGSSPGSWHEVRELIAQELSSMRQEGITPRELRRAKAQVIGGLMLSLESTSSRMGRIGKTKLLLGRVVTTEEAASRVQAVSLDDVNRVAAGVLSPEREALAILGPIVGRGG